MKKFSSRKTVLMIMMVLMFIFSAAVFADDEINGISNYRLINKESGKALQLYSNKFPHPEIKSNQYKLFAETGELTTFDVIDYRGQLFTIQSEGDAYRFSSSLVVDKTIIAVDKKSFLKPNAKAELVAEEDEKDYITTWKIEKKDNEFYTIANSKDEDLVLTQYGDFQVRFSVDEGKSTQLWRLEWVSDNQDLTGEQQEEAAEELENEENDAYTTEDAISDWFAKIEQQVDNREGLDFDGAYGSQCVDLIYDYTYSIFHLGQSRGNYRKSINGGNGGEIFSTASSTYYDKIPYNSDVEVKRGDIVVYSKGYYGHSAIVERVDEDGFDVITINGSRGKYVRRQRYDKYSGYYQVSQLVGVLRPRPEMLVK